MFERLLMPRLRSTTRSVLLLGPTAIWLSKDVAGLRQASVVLCRQVSMLDRAKLVGRIGELPAVSLQRVHEGLRTALALT